MCGPGVHRRIDREVETSRTCAKDTQSDMVSHLQPGVVCGELQQALCLTIKFDLQSRDTSLCRVGCGPHISVRRLRRRQPRLKLFRRAGCSALRGVEAPLHLRCAPLRSFYIAAQCGALAVPLRRSVPRSLRCGRQLRAEFFLGSGCLCASGVEVACGKRELCLQRAHLVPRALGSLPLALRQLFCRLPLPLQVAYCLHHSTCRVVCIAGKGIQFCEKHAVARSPRRAKLCRNIQPEAPRPGRSRFGKQ